MKKLSVLIVDDEPWGREAVRLRIANDPRFHIVDEADNGSDAILLMQSLAPDVVFLDIEMPALSGLQAAFQSHTWFNGAIVFITAFSHYAVDAFEVEAFNYLVKPIKDTKFQQVLDKLYQLQQMQVQQKLNVQMLKQLSKQQSNDTQNNSKYLQRISLKDKQAIHIIDVKDIYYIESAGNYLGVTTNKGTYIQRLTVKQMSALLDPQQFIRCHRSAIINKSYIESLTTKEKETVIKTLDGKSHPVSRRYSATVKLSCGLD